MEKEFGRQQLLQLPCHHHIHELLCAAAAKLVFGDSKRPKQEAFTSRIAAWPELDKSNNEVYQPLRTTQNQCEHAVEFWQIALSVEDCQHWSHRNDYWELLELTIVFRVRGKWLVFQYVVDNVLVFCSMSSVICTALLNYDIKCTPQTRRVARNSQWGGAVLRFWGRSPQRS